MDTIRITEADFKVQQEYDWLCENNSVDGAVVFFVGRVRDFSKNEKVLAIFLEHYPQMTERSLQEIITNARQRWQLGKVAVVHRVGRILAAEQIVFVGVTSQHRENAFSAANFIMDFLKTQAPFWKKEITPEGEHWVEAKASDQDKARHWR